MNALPDKLLDRVAGIISRYSMTSPGSRIGVAVSGGADSVVLLHILAALAPKLEIQPIVVHVNHQLRGAESEADEEFVRNLAEAFRFAISAHRVGPPDSSFGNLEETARKQRRDYFHTLLRGQVQRIALGHTRSDQAETVLFRILRGTGPTGLAAMRPFTDDGLIRPLLTSSRDEVREWAQTQGIAWRQDSSNSDLRFTRNQIRQNALPYLVREFNPNLEAVLSGLADVTQTEEDYWSSVIEPLFRDLARQTHFGLILAVEPLSQLHLAVQRRIIRRAAVAVRADARALNLEHVNAILALCGSIYSHDRVIVPGIDATRSFGQLRLTSPSLGASAPRHYCCTLAPGDQHDLPFHAGRICLELSEPQCEKCANFKEELDFVVEVAELDGSKLSGDQVSGSLHVRNWEPGDSIRRPGHKAAEKLKFLFQEYRVPLWERKHWAVVVLGEEVVWARRFGCSALFQSSKESRQVLRLTYQSTGVAPGT